jgi:hypothetical protein
MNSNNTFSLSLQKQIQQQHVSIDSEISRAFQELNFRSLLSRSGILKQKGVCYHYIDVFNRFASFFKTPSG